MLEWFCKRQLLEEPNLGLALAWEWSVGAVRLKQALLSLVLYLHLFENFIPLIFYLHNKEFPWKELGDGASVCDVGGGIGNITLQLAKAYPTLKLKLQDLPERIVQAKNEVWPKECPEAIKENRIQFEPIDFLTQSPVEGCNVYYVS